MHGKVELGLQENKITSLEGLSSSTLTDDMSHRNIIIIENNGTGDRHSMMSDAILIVQVTDDEDPALCRSTRSKQSAFALHWAFCPSWVSVFFLQNESFD